MFWVITKWLFSRVWIYIFGILACVNFIAILYLTDWLWPFLHSKDFSVQASAVNILLVSIGTTSILVLAAQWRQQGAWNRVLSYHEYFSELPRRESLVMLETCFRRLSITAPTTAEPLKDSDVAAILADAGTTGRRASTICKGYLDDFEEFCAAVDARVVSSAYAIDIEGSRVIRAFYGFEPLIRKLREQQDHAMATTGTATRNGNPMRSKYYEELERVARRWRQKREKEHKTLANSAEWVKRLFSIGPSV